MAIIFNPNKKFYFTDSSHHISDAGGQTWLSAASVLRSKNTCDMDYVLTYADRGFQAILTQQE